MPAPVLDKPLFRGQLLAVTTTFTRKPKPPATVGPVFDPATVIFKVKDPSGTYSTHEAPTREKEGVYEAPIALALDGTWWVRAEAHDETGDTIAVDEFNFPVEPSEFP